MKTYIDGYLQKQVKGHLENVNIYKISRPRCMHTEVFRELANVLTEPLTIILKNLGELRRDQKILKRQIPIFKTGQGVNAL